MKEKIRDILRKVILAFTITILLAVSIPTVWPIMLCMWIFDKEDETISGICSAVLQVAYWAILIVILVR